MRSITKIVTVALVLTLASIANAQVVPLVDRPLVLTEGVGEIALDFTVGLNADSPGKTIGMGTVLFGDRHSGVSVAYGFAKGIEAGLSIPYFNVEYTTDRVTEYNIAMKGWPLLRDTSTANHFGPAEVWGRFRLTDFIAAEVSVLIPIERIRYNRVGARIGLPIKYVIKPKLLAFHIQPEVTLGFGQSDVSMNTTIQANFFIDTGLTVNPIKELALDLSLGYGRMLAPSPSELDTDLTALGTGYLPVSLALMYSPIPAIDLTMGFSLDNLTPGTGHGPADSRSLTVGFGYKF